MRCPLIAGLPGEDDTHSHASLDRVLRVGVDGLKLHPLQVVRHTKLAIEWKRGKYAPLAEADYVRIAADLIERTLGKSCSTAAPRRPGVEDPQPCRLIPSVGGVPPPTPAHVAERS